MDFSSVGTASSLSREFILETGGQSVICEADLILIRDFDIPSFPKSWIIYSSLGLCDSTTRAR